LQLVLSFVAGLILGLICSLFFLLGVKVRRNIETTDTISGHIEKLKPILRTDLDEAELEERIKYGA